MKAWMKSLKKWFKELDEYMKTPEAKKHIPKDLKKAPKHVKRAYGIDKDKNIVALGDIEQIFVEISDEKGLLLDLESNRYFTHGEKCVTVRSWPSTPENSRSLSINPCAGNLVEIGLFEYKRHK